MCCGTTGMNQRHVLWCAVRLCKSKCTCADSFVVLVKVSTGIAIEASVRYRTGSSPPLVCLRLSSLACLLS